MPFTPVGSVGDIIALSHLIKDLIMALDDDESRGSSAEYQDSVRALWTLNRILGQVAVLCGMHHQTMAAELNGLLETMRRVSGQVQKSVEPVFNTMKKFGPSLCNGGSGNKLRDASRKVQWRVSHSDELKSLRVEIDRYCSFLSVLISIANIHLARSNNEKLHLQLMSSDKKAEISIREQNHLLKEIRDCLPGNNKAIHTGNGANSKTLESIRIDWTQSLGPFLKRCLQSIFTTTFATYKMVLNIRGSLPSHLERCLHQEPFRLEDSHGRIRPIYMDCINSWDAFDAWLEVQFRNLPGHRRVQNKAFVLHESVANRDIERRRPWESVLLPGQRIVMCMLFTDDFGSGHCPKCYCESPAATDSDIKCDQCGMWYRWKPEPDESNAVETSRKIADQREVISTGPSDLDVSEKRKLDYDYNESVASFKRVRMLSKVQITWLLQKGDLVDPAWAEIFGSAWKN